MIEKHKSEQLPEFFYSYETGKPFSHCLTCGESLDEKAQYAIEKIFKNNKQLHTREIVYEYAICMDCASDVQDEISAESMLAIQNLYQEYAPQLMMKLEYLHATEKYTIDSWVERCSFTGKEIRLCEEFTVSAIIEEGKLVYEHAPLAVSDQFMEMMQECMSKKTRDYFDGFRDEHFDLPPEIKDLISGPTIGVI